ncbi:MAG: hypothetical protein HYU36_06045 [Planctomycetes bacterium]|nr:hypothetical protein [Planctomycetota bacterium]
MNLADGANQLHRSVAQMKADFHHARQEAIQRSRKRRQEFLQNLAKDCMDLKDTVSRMRGGCRQHLREMAQGSRSHRTDFTSGLQHEVKGLRNELAAALDHVRHLRLGGPQPAGKTAEGPDLSSPASVTDPPPRERVEKGLPASKPRRRTSKE